ncbi:MAG: DUF4331 domain-containing protein [Proteobacteria bacterium]|nr:DUF4331 domain-containing protein [Burkholderiales bacterium]
MIKCPLNRHRLADAIGKLGIGLAFATVAAASFASSHREAPFIASQAKADATDVYLFRSYETGRQNFVTVLANYQPFQDPQGGPNFYLFSPDALYEIHFDNNGDSVPDLTFQFRFKNMSKMTALTVGGRDVKIPLINSGGIIGVNPAALNVRETFTVDVLRPGNIAASLTNAAGGAVEFDKPVDNIGDKVFGGPTGYATYANQHIYNVMVPGCATPARVFVGQRKEPFYIAVGKIFDLINLNPLGPEAGGNNNDLESKNISTLAMELPISCVTVVGEPVIGAFTTASLRQDMLAAPAGLSNSNTASGPFVQVSRLGMPLVNELVIGIDDKDAFNASRPTDDVAKFADYVTNPILPAVVELLFPAAKAPTKFPRTDLIAAFLTGIAGVNQPRNAVPGEMMRLNTAIRPVPAGGQNPLGVAAGDLAGFPNGRRPGDDVVDLSLRVAMGALCVLTGPGDGLRVGCTPGDAPAGGLALTDGVRKNSTNFFATFPYLTTPLPGNFNPPAPAGSTFP